MLTIANPACSTIRHHCDHLCFFAIACIDLHQGYVDGLNEPEVNPYLEVRRERQTSESVARFIASNSQSSDSVLFGILDHGNPSHVGTLRLQGIDKSSGHCYNGICIFNKSLWGCGIASDLIKNVTSWAFVALSLDSIEPHACLENDSWIRAFERAGYRRLLDSYKSLPYEVAPLKHSVLVADRPTC